jgi:hypothetical protein
VFFDRDVEVTCSTEFFLELFDSRAFFFNALSDCIWHGDGPVDVVAFLWRSDMESVKDGFSFLWVLRFLGQAVIKQNVAGLALNVRNTIPRDVGHLNEVRVGGLG